MRDYFKEFAVLSTTPTKKGEIEIDFFHKYFPIKRICKKPLSQIEKMPFEFVLIMQAESEKLVTVSLELSESSKKEKLNEFYEYYLNTLLILTPNNNLVPPPSSPTTSDPTTNTTMHDSITSIPLNDSSMTDTITDNPHLNDSEGLGVDTDRSPTFDPSFGGQEGNGKENNGDSMNDSMDGSRNEERENVEINSESINHIIDDVMTEINTHKTNPTDKEKETEQEKEGEVENEEEEENTEETMKYNRMEWNEERKKVIDLFFKLIQEDLEKEMREKLYQKAKDKITEECKFKFKELLMNGKYYRDKSSVISIIVGKYVYEPTILIALHPNGEIMNYLKLKNTNNEGKGATTRTRNPNEHELGPDGWNATPAPPGGVNSTNWYNSIQENGLEDYENNLQWKKNQENGDRIKEFILSTKPAVIVIGASCIRARKFKQDVEKIVDEINKDFYSVAPCIWGTTEVARLCSISKIYQKEYPNYSQQVRCCISLGRYLQEPLNEISKLFNENQDICFVKLHDLQGILSRSKLMKSLEAVLMNFVNRIGINIYDIINNSNSYFNQLQFICGLGKRKSHRFREIVNQLYRKNKIITREVVSELHENGIVNTNLIGFLKIQSIINENNPFAHSDKGRESDTSDNECTITDEMQIVTMLDETRILPKHYEAARKIMKYILHKEEIEYDDEEITIKELEDLFLSIENLPYKLELFSLPTDTDEFEQYSIYLLHQIKQELIHPFKDTRYHYKQPNEDELFYLLTGENDKSLYVGLKLTCTVLVIKYNLLTVKLECGLVGFISIDQFSDDPVDNLYNYVVVGQAIYAKIISIDKFMFNIQLTSKKSAIIKSNHVEVGIDDPFLIHERFHNPFTTPSSVPARKDSSRAKTVKKRLIEHPLFKNYTYKQTELELKSTIFLLLLSSLLSLLYSTPPPPLLLLLFLPSPFYPLPSPFIYVYCPPSPSPSLSLFPYYNTVQTYHRYSFLSNLIDFIFVPCTLPCLSSFKFHGIISFPYNIVQHNRFPPFPSLASLIPLFPSPFPFHFD